MTGRRLSAVGAAILGLGLSACSLVVVPTRRGGTPPLSNTPQSCGLSDPLVDTAFVAASALVLTEAVLGRPILPNTGAPLSRGAAVVGTGFGLAFGASAIYGFTHVQYCPAR